MVSAGGSYVKYMLKPVCAHIYLDRSSLEVDQ